MQEPTGQPNRELRQRSCKADDKHLHRPRRHPARPCLLLESKIRFRECLVRPWCDVRRVRFTHFAAPLPMPEGTLGSSYFGLRGLSVPGKRSPSLNANFFAQPTGTGSACAKTNRTSQRPLSVIESPKLLRVQFERTGHV